MTRTGTLVATVSRCALLATLVCVARSAAAQSADGWSATRNTSFVATDNSVTTDWQPSRPANAAPQAKQQSDADDAATTRWVEPTREKTPPAPPKRAIAPKVSATQSNVPANREPKQFVEPTDAKQLVESANAPQNQPAPRTNSPKPVTDKQAAVVKKSTTNGSAPSGSAKPLANDPPPTPRAATNKPAAAKAGTSTAQTNNVQPRKASSPANNNNAQANNGRSAPSRADAIRARVRDAQQDDSFDNHGYVNPLKQAAYHMDGPEELPPGAPTGAPMSSHSGPMPHAGPMMGPSDGQWIDSSSSFEGGGCGPSCDCVDGCGPACGDYIGCGDSCGCGSECGDHPCEICNIGPGDDESCHQVRIRVPKFQEVMIFGGVHGFKGPLDQERNSGNFGFQEGINVGAKLPYTDFGYQFGYAATESQLSGDSNTGATDAFTQSFFTAGVFHRTCDGFQGGLAWDIMHDDRDSSSDFEQVRGEFSFVDQGCHELGVMGSVHLGSETLGRIDDSQSTINTRFQATDQFLLFYRMHGCRGGEGRAFAGISDDSDVIVGADFLLPLHCSWSLQSEFTYLIPDDSAGAIGARQEAWNLSIAMVWHWYGQARECHSNPYRPLFNVADNGSMIIDDRP